MKKMREIAEKIIKFDLDETTLNSLRNAFFQIMRENNIRAGTEDGPGTRFDNYEWTICKTLFLEQVKSQLEMSFLFKGIPKDLHHYKKSTNQALQLSGGRSRQERQAKPKASTK